jgi:3-hydroxy-9,10-secoandrosta-1,3,5(10)-triene-9,17-dione monooxygenase reductase component
VADNSERAHDNDRQDAGRLQEAVSQTLSANRFHQAVSSLPTGVTVVTTVVDGEPAGTTVASFLMLSMERQMVGFGPAASSATFSQIRQSGAFCANVLTVHQEDISTAFAMKPGPERFTGVSWRPAPRSGSPVLEGVAAWFDCRFTTVYDYSDHVFVIGEVVDFDTPSQEMPLVFHRGRYARLETGQQALA